MKSIFDCNYVFVLTRPLPAATVISYTQLPLPYPPIPLTFLPSHTPQLPPLPLSQIQLSSFSPLPLAQLIRHNLVRGAVSHQLALLGVGFGGAIGIQGGGRVREAATGRRCRALRLIDCKFASLQSPKKKKKNTSKASTTY